MPATKIREDGIAASEDEETINSGGNEIEEILQDFNPLEKENILRLWITATLQNVWKITEKTRLKINYHQF